jgi:hypothetical protein
MLRLLIVLMFIAPLALAGCKKNQSKAAVTTPATLEAQAEKQEETLRQAEAGGRFLPAQIAQAEAMAEEQVPQPERDALRQAVITQAAALKLELAEEQKVVKGLAAIPQGMPVAQVIVDVYHQQQKKVPDANRAVLEYLGRIVEKGQKQQELAPQQEQAEAEQAKVDEQYEQDMNALRPAADCVGDWRSIGEMREGQDKFLVEHDDKYYKVLLLSYKGQQAVFQEYNEGEMKSKAEYPYTYDATSGKLILTSPSGGPGDVYLVMAKANDPNHIYVRPTNDVVYAFTVYEKIGNGGKPSTGTSGAPPVVGAPRAQPN